MENSEIMSELQAILDKENPCNVQVIEGKATCREGEPCCQGCNHLGPKGCKVFAPACKFYFCQVAWKAMSQESRDRITQLGLQYHGTLFFRNGATPMITPPPYIW